MTTAIELNSYTHDKDQQSEINTKILVIEFEEDILSSMRGFLELNKIVGYKVTKTQVINVLKCNIDLGAIFIPESDSSGNSNFDLAIEINKARPELPMFVRFNENKTLDDLPEEEQKLFSGSYIGTEYDHLKELLDTFLFTRHYPNEFVKGIKDLSLESFKATFKGMDVISESPYIVKDKIIYGELFSLMPLESYWCRGYMMLQTDEINLLDVIKANKTSLPATDANFRHVNAVLGELSNMIWGSFKQNYGMEASVEVSRIRVEIPIIIDHSRSFISFGTDDPQLCFKYTLIDPDFEISPITIYQKFIFSLDWSPEKFKEHDKNVEELVENGSLEMF